MKLVERWTPNQLHALLMKAIGFAGGWNINRKRENQNTQVGPVKQSFFFPLWLTIRIGTRYFYNELRYSRLCIQLIINICRFIIYVSQTWDLIQPIGRYLYNESRYSRLCIELITNISFHYLCKSKIKPLSTNRKHIIIHFVSSLFSYPIHFNTSWV